MIKLIEKTKNKNGDIKREVKSEKEIKKNKSYKNFMSELSNSFSIPKNKFILIALTEEEDENPINDQDDLDSYIDEAKEFLIIMEEGSIKTKPDKKTKEKKKTRTIVILRMMMTKMIMIVIKMEMKKRKMKREKKEEKRII